MNSILTLFLILVLIYLYIYSETKYNEKFMVYWSGEPVEPLPSIDSYTNWPFWNMRLGQTSNMSYDLRGDPMVIPKYPFMWNYSTLTPILKKIYEIYIMTIIEEPK